MPMIRLLRRSFACALVVLGFLLATAPVGAPQAGQIDLRAAAVATGPAAAAGSSAWNQAPEADPDGSKASLWVGGDDWATVRVAIAIDWPRPARSIYETTRDAPAPVTHPACASPPRAPPTA
jgi:hypothetical protein